MRDIDYCTISYILQHAMHNMSRDELLADTKLGALTAGIFNN